jgi:hypothetical protein
MNDNILKTKCVICGKPAVTTAAQILVCEEHANQYAEEGRKYLPDHQRQFWRELQQAQDSVSSVVSPAVVSVQSSITISKKYLLREIGDGTLLLAEIDERGDLQYCKNPPKVCTVDAMGDIIPLPNV